MNRLGVLNNIFNEEEAGNCSEDEPEDRLETDSDYEDDVIEGSGDYETLTVENFNLIRSNSVTFENFTAMVQADSGLFFDQEHYTAGGASELVVGRGRGSRGQRSRGRGNLNVVLEGGAEQAVVEKPKRGRPPKKPN